MSERRQYTSRRQSIVRALTEVFKQINGTGEYNINLFDNVEPRLLFWDEVEQFPAVNVTSGPETVVYQGGGFKERYLSVTVRCYVQEENAAYALDALFEDIETVIEDNARLRFIDKKGAECMTHDITIISLDSDEGVLEPVGVGEMLIQVRY